MKFIPILLLASLTLTSCGLFRFGGDDAEEETEPLPPPSNLVAAVNDEMFNKSVETQATETPKPDLPKPEITNAGGWDVGDPTQDLPSRQDLSAPVMPILSEAREDEERSEPITIQPPQ